MEKHQSFFAKNLRYLRKNHVFTLDEMRTRTGFKSSTLSNYENDNTEPDIKGLINISKFFGIAIDDILLVDLENVHLSNGKAGGKNEAGSTSKSAANSASKVKNYPIIEDTPMTLNEPDPTTDWMFVSILKGMDKKLDILLSAKEKK